MEDIRIGIICCGIIGEEHIKKYKDITGCSVETICDIDEAKLNAVGDKYGMPEM